MFISFLNGARRHIVIFSFSPPKPLIMSIYLKTSNTVQSCPLLIREFGYRKQTKLEIFSISAKLTQPVKAQVPSAGSITQQTSIAVVCLGASLKFLTAWPSMYCIMKGWLCAQAMTIILDKLFLF